jgi:acyl-CoA thioester hydrolase
MIRVPILEASANARRHTHPFRVAFGDTDAAGIVYYATYLRYFEQARTELLREAGVSYAELFAAGVVMPVVEQWLRYRAPACYDDLVAVTVWVHEARRASVLVGCQIHRGDLLLVEGAARLGCVDVDGRPRRLHPAILALGDVGAHRG